MNRSAPGQKAGKARRGLAGAATLAGIGLMVAARVAAQDLPFRHLTTEDGLANVWVMSILRDTRGFMWFGTSTGLNRYDGYDMEVFRHRREDRGSIADDRINMVYEDREGVIWVGTRSSLSRFDRDRNSFRNYMVEDTVEPMARRRVYAILEDSRRRLWVGTTSGLFLFDRRRGQASRVALGPALDTTRCVVQALLEDERHHLWIGTERSGLIDFDLSTGRVHVYRHDPRDPGSLPDSDIRGIVADTAGRLWLGTYNVGLVMLDPRTGRVRSYSHDPRNPLSLSIDPIRRLASDGAGGLWVGTENGGLDHFDPRTGVFQHNRADPANPTRLNSNSVWALYQEPQGTLWVGTFSGGVNVLRLSSSWLRHYAAMVEDPSGLSFNSVTAFAEDRAGGIWVATDGGGLNRFDPRRGQFRRYTTRNSNLNRDAVQGVTVDHQGMVWIGTWLGGLSRLDPATGRFTSFTTANSNIPDDHVFGLCVDRLDRVWVGTWRSGLLVFDRKTRSFTRYRIGPTDPETQITLIRELRDGRLALGTLDGGLMLFDPARETFTRYGADVHSANALLSFEIRALLQTDDQHLWVGTAAGLDRLDLRTSRVEHFAENAGLPGVPISGLAMDSAGYLWISTDRGIHRYDLRTRMHWDYGAADGFGRDFNPRAYLHARDGTIYFGGNSGMDVISPNLIGRNAVLPPIVFTGFQLFNQERQIGAEGSPLVKHISETKHLTLNHSQSVFTIEFAALDYTAPSKNHYAYMLEGFDRDWIQSGSAHSATYTNLPPGEYVFRVRGSNSDGRWNRQGAALRITVLPGWWRTWWFVSGMTIVILAATLLFIAHERRRHRYLQRNVLEILGAMQRFSTGDFSVALDVSSDDEIGKLRQGVNTAVADRKRAEEELRQSQKMEAVGRLAGGVAHDFNNLLTAIKGNAQLALSDMPVESTAREELEEVQRAAERAGSLTRQLLAFSRKQILQPRVLSLNDIVGDMGRLLRRTVGEDVELQTVLHPAVGHVLADPGQLEQVLLNLAVNARDAMPRGGILRIETSNVAASAALRYPEAEPIPYVAMAVADNGIGMGPEVLERIFEPFFTTKDQGKGTGLGLSTVYGIVTQSGGFVRVDSSPGTGTTFSVFLPRVEAPQAAQDVPPLDTSSSRGTATVLLVEDERAVRRLATRVLERAGYTVLAADSGEAAIALSEEHRDQIDMLLTDVVMPGMSGRELAERLLPAHLGMRLLYSSGYTEDAIVRHGVSGEGAAFLEKPFTPDQLLRKVSEVLDSPVGRPETRV